MHRATLQAMETRLLEAQFMRLHRTALVRISAIKGLKVDADGANVAQLSNGESVRVSESYAKKVKKLFS